MSKFVDHIYPVLYGEPNLDNSQRSDLWDLAHGASNVNELQQHLSQLPQLHPDLVNKLLIAKGKPSVELDTVDKVVGAIQRMGTLDPKLVDLAESHSNVFKALLASQTEE